MKLNWFSPLPPARSGIADYTTGVVARLLQHADVTLWTNQAKWDPRLNELAEIRSYTMDALPWPQLNRADMTIYNIGNNPDFHGVIWEVALRHPGIVVLHEDRLHELFFNLYRGRWRDIPAYLAQVEFYYGRKGRLAVEECCRNSGQTLPLIIEAYPLTALALDGALGAMVHTRAAYETLRIEGRCPVAHAALPFTPTREATVGRARGTGKFSKPPPYRLVVFGFLGGNRRLESVLAALSEFARRDLFRLDIYGDVDDSAGIRRMIRRLGLRRLVRLHGYVKEHELDEALSAAHLAINLRYPTMGEASASQLRIWSHSLPSLVTPVGWYADLPAGAVKFVRPRDEVADIQRHLTEFLADPDEFAEMGKWAHEFLVERHSIEGYADSVMDLVSAAQAFRPAAAIQKLILRTRMELTALSIPDEVEQERLEAARRKSRLIYGRSELGSVLSPGGPPSLLRRAKRFIKRRLPRKLYMYYSSESAAKRRLMG